MPREISRARAADLVGPTTGDRIRLADTDLLIEITEDRTGPYGDEVVFGGGKMIRESMGQARATRAEGTPDVVITGAVVLDHWGVIKADIGVRDGRIVALGKAGNPDIKGNTGPCCVTSCGWALAHQAGMAPPALATPASLRPCCATSRSGASVGGPSRRRGVRARRTGSARGRARPRRPRDAGPARRHGLRPRGVRAASGTIRTPNTSNRRRITEAEGFLMWGDDKRRLLDLAVTALCVAALSACGAPSRAGGTATLGTVRLPDQARSPVVQRLDDGTPVWVTNLGDGEVSVLAATVLDEDPKAQPGEIRGLRTHVLWDITGEQFLGGGAWDPRGHALTPDGQVLDEGRLQRYRTTIRDDGTAVVHELVPGEPRPPKDPSPDIDARAIAIEDVRLVVDGLDAAPLSVDQALTEPDGTMVVVDADVVRNGDAPLRVCATDESGPVSHEIARCPDDAPRPSDLTVPVPEGRSWAVRYGPLLARVNAGTFSDLAQLGGGEANGAGSDESMAVSEATRVRVASGSVAVVEGWKVVEVRGSDVCSVLSQRRTLYVVRGKVEPCDHPLEPELPGAVVRAAEDDPATTARLRDGTRRPLFGTPALAADDVTRWLHPDVFTYDYFVTGLGMVVSTVDDPAPDDPLYSYVDTEALLRSLRPE